MVFEDWKKQFTADRFSLKHEDPTVFVTSQWQYKLTPSAWYLAYRWLLTLFFICSWILSIVDDKNLDKPYMYRVKWLIYLTNWGYTLCTVQSILCTVMLSRRFIASRKGLTGEDNNHALGIYKIYWATNIIATDAAIAITILYWSIIYKDSKGPLDYLNVLVHGTNSAFMFIELCVVKHPVKLNHCYMPFLFGAVYATFSAIYYFSGGTSRDGKITIYSVLDWSKPASTVGICFGALIFMVVLHCFTYVLYLFKIWVYKKIRSKTENNNEKSTVQFQDKFSGFDNDAMMTNDSL